MHHYVNRIGTPESDLLHYLNLTSLPFIPEKREVPSLDDLWQIPEEVDYPTLIYRPTMPTGNLSPSYFVVGDAPGVGGGRLVGGSFDRVFVYGRSSHLLRKALIKTGIYYKCWFTNLLKLATPKNRPSGLDEVMSFQWLLEQELEILKPRKIILLGAHVNEMWLKTFGNLKYDIIKVRHPASYVRGGMGAEEYADHLRTLIGR